MNFIKLSTVLEYRAKHSHIFIWAITISLFFTSCGEGLPEYLKEASVVVSKWTPTKEVVLKKDGLNLVKAIVPLQDSSDFLIISDNQVCKLSNYKLDLECKVISPNLYDLDIIRNTSGEPSYIVGKGLWSEPSAAVFDINGQLKWKKDNKYENIGLTAVLDDKEERFVVMEKDSVLLYLKFDSGELVRKGSHALIIASADFTGDGHREVLVERREDDFAILDGIEHELSNLQVPHDFIYWYKPIVTSSAPPFFLLSGEDTLAVYNSNLKLHKKFNAKGSPFPIHVVAATFLGDGPNAPFAAVYKGKGGWHRSILYIFSSTGELVYKEILEGDYQSITSVPQRDGIGFLLGGRNEVLLYSFQQ